MKQIYNFESSAPPILTEAMLRRERRKRCSRIQIILLALAGVLSQIAVVLFGYSALNWFPWMTMLSSLYILSSAVGGSVIAILYTKKGGFAAWELC